MLPLHRHQLAHPTEAGWRHALDRDWDAQARDCLAHWASQRLPLVVTRQSGDASAVALGLPAPGRWSRRRLALGIARSELVYFDEFPCAAKALPLLPASSRAAWRTLCAGLKAAGMTARIYGSYGWQLITGLDHVRESSDIDLWLAVADERQADVAAALLQSFQSSRLRLDGELMLADGRAVAWREWQLWRQGRARHLLLKSITGSALAEAL